MALLARSPEPAYAHSTSAVVTAMWRGLAVLRPVTLLYAVWTTIQRDDQMERPWLAWIVMGVMAAWTVAMLLVGRQTARLLAIELALGTTFILLTRAVDSAEVIEAGAQTLPGVWPAAAVIGWALLRGWPGGLLAAAVVAIADLLEVLHPTQHTINNIVLLFLLGGCIGYCADLARMGHEALTEALRVQVEVRERDRLARTVHDGVLQTLAFIHRRGTQLGGAAGELGAMAADQEQLLRALVSGVPSAQLDVAVGGRVDLRELLARYAGGQVQIVPPADPVWLPRKVADEIAAAVQAALENVRHHAGDGAHAWVLIEDEATRVRVTIRDDGVGLDAGRLAAAAAGGRMGVANSIQGRLADLDGYVEIRSHPGDGTTVEMWVPTGGAT